MIRSAKIRITMLALMLAVSHVALISHVTAHFEPGLDQCELCVSQAQLLTAVPTADHFVDIEPQTSIAYFSTATFAVTYAHRFAFRQRAPPVPAS